MSEQSVLSAMKLTKTYSDGQQTITVLEGLDVEVGAGEWLAIIGASGAGKSTLLNLLGGLDIPTSGEIEVAGTALPALSELERSQWRNQRLGLVSNAPPFAGVYGQRVWRCPLELAVCPKRLRASEPSIYWNSWAYQIGPHTGPRRYQAGSDSGLLLHEP